MSLPWKSFLPAHEDIERVKKNLVVLVSRILAKHFKSLSPLSRNEAQASDMFDIMHTIQGYLGNCKKKIASGGDQLTCERHAGSSKASHDGWQHS